MSDPETATSTATLLKEMKDQMVVLTAKVEELQHNQTGEPSLMVQEEEEDNAMGPGNLVALTESTKAFLEAAFSTTLANAYRKKRVECIGVQDCYSIRCPKLHPVRKRILNPALKSMPSDAKVFRKAVPILFGDKFAKLATDRSDQLKAISWFSKP